MITITIIAAPNHSYLITSNIILHTIFKLIFNLKKIYMTTLTKSRNPLSVFRSSDVCEPSAFFRTGILGMDNNLLEVPLVIPEANIIENEKDYTVELAAPGLDKKDFKIEVDNGVLIISAKKEEKKEEEEKANFKRREFSYNSLYRSFTLPENSNPEKIDAKYENGLLRLSIPKMNESKSESKKQIRIA